MRYAKLYGAQFPVVKKNPNATRSPSLIVPIHSAIADQIEEMGYKTKSLRNHEYEYVGPYGSKMCDIAIFDNKSQLKGVILTKWIRSNYGKNANNYFEGMRGESQLFVDGGVPIYQTIFIPTFENPTQKSYDNYSTYIKSYVPKGMKVGVWYMDVDDAGRAAYSSKKIIEGVEPTLTDGIKNFVEGLG